MTSISKLIMTGRIQVQSSEFRSCSLTTLPFANRWGVVKMGWILGEQGVPSLEDWEEQVHPAQCSVYPPALSRLSLPHPEARRPLGTLAHQWMGLELLLRGLIFHMTGETLRLQSPPSQKDLLSLSPDMACPLSLNSSSSPSSPPLHSISIAPIRFFAGYGCSRLGWESC